MKVKIKKTHPDAIIPKYQTLGAVGFDLHALEDTTLLPGQTYLIRTGLAFKIPQGFELQIRPRSGVSVKTGLRVANSPGTIDFDFRGEVNVILDNKNRGGLGIGSEHIKKGDRIAQAVLCPIFRATFIEVDDLEDTARGLGGFGSTGA